VSEKRKNLLVLAVVIALAAASAVAVSVKGFTQGLDLKGGLQVVLKAEPTNNQPITQTILDEAAAVMRRRIDPNGTLQPEVRTAGGNTIEISIPGTKNPNQVSDLLTAGGFLNFDFYRYLAGVSEVSGQRWTVAPDNSAYDLLSRADKAHSASASTAAQWALFDAKTHAFYRKAPILRTQLQVLQIVGAKTKPAGTKWLFVPEGTMAVSCDNLVDGCFGATAKSHRTVWYLFVKPPASQVVTAADIASASSTTDQSGNPIVSLTYQGQGAQHFLNATKSSVVEALNRGITAGFPNAIVVAGKLVSTPVTDPQANPNGIDVRSAIPQSSEINNISKPSADRLALEIQSGTLPVTFATQSENIVSATLGKDSLRSGLIAGGIGLAFVMVFLIAFYGFLGLIADIALIIYGLLLAGIVAILPVTMTLPGIAGTILTIGVAADANIVIFERIKEEVRAGRSIRAAIATGYRRGFHTIIDANVVTLITAGVLYASATSSVKGFALMLLIGVVTSIFTAVVATRALLMVLSGFAFMSSRRVLGAIGTGDRWKRFDFIGRKTWWFAFSGIILVVGAISLGTSGLNRGIDFTGGSQLDFHTSKALSQKQMSSLVDPFMGSDVVVRGVVGAHQTQSNTFTHFQVQSHFLSSDVQKKLTSTIENPQNAGATQLSVKNVSSSFGQSVLNSAYLAIVFSLIIIFLYVTYRFEWTFAVPVMVALGHDILLTIGVYSLSGRSVTADTVAAVLTVLGYSLYDTVIVFDRVRENVPILRRYTASKIVNESLAETITRSLNTSLVTLIPVVLLFIFGSGSLTDFAFALIVGVASGAYSSIFIAAPLLAILMERQPAFVKRRSDLARAGELPTTGQPAVAVAAGIGPVLPGPTAPLPPAPAPTRKRRRAHGRNR
jgi:SecD/SecF fusion protein